MPAMEPFSNLFGINKKKLSKEESSLLEAELFIRICNELKEFFKQQYKNFFYLMKLNMDKENLMLEGNFILLLIQDILASGEYTLQGIARYTDIPEDVVYDLATGLNTKPLAIFFRSFFLAKGP